MSFETWNANIDPAAVLKTALDGMRNYFARNSSRELARIESAVAAGEMTPTDGFAERTRALASAAETERSLEQNVRPRLEAFLTDPHVRRISPAALSAIADAVDDARWEHLYEAFFSDIKFGTGGIRGRAVMSVGDLRSMASGGIDAPFLRGPNLFCDLTVLRLSSAVARYAADHKLNSIAIGYDSRIGGRRFAELIARLFMHQGLAVNLFDEPCPFPELSFSVVHLGADLGIFISASHNDKRYNGYKLTSATGAQLTNTERETIYRNYVAKARFEDVPDLPPIESFCEKLTVIGSGHDYPRCKCVDLHPTYLKHMRQFIVDEACAAKSSPTLKVGYCAFYGAGSKLVPMLLRSTGFSDIREITIRSINMPDGFFPCFSYTQQPDPGDPSSAKIAVDAFIAEHGKTAFDSIDILIGTDPDADRMGVVVKVPHSQRGIYDGEWTLLKADDVWALLLWYRLRKLADSPEGKALLSSGFIAQSHVTSDLINEIAEKSGLARLITWVGFSLLAEAVSFAWKGENLTSPYEYDHRFYTTMHSVKDYKKGVSTVNLGCFEESNGFSILGSPPSASNPNALGDGGHVRDKDGTLAALLICEVAAYAKSIGKTLIELLDDLTIELGTGLYVNKYRPDPPVGQYEGVNAIVRKLRHLHAAEELRAIALHGDLCIAGLKVTGVDICAGKGKYAADPDHNYIPHRDWEDAKARAQYMLPDENNDDDVRRFIGDMVAFGLRLGEDMTPSQQYASARAYFFERIAVFPEEGMRFYLSDDRMSFVTLRPSGTSRNLKIYVQLRSSATSRSQLELEKKRLMCLADDVLVDFARQLGMKW